MFNRTSMLMISLLLTLSLVVTGCTVNDQGQIVLDNPIALPSPPAVSQPDAAQPETADAVQEITATVNTRSLRVRQAPDTESPIVAGLREGDTVRVTGRTLDAAWFEIQVPDVNTLGWVTADFVTLSGDVANIPVPGEGEAVAEAPAATPEPAAEEAAEETGEEVAEVTEETSAEMAAPSIDIVETAMAVDEFSVLVTLLEVTNLAEGLQGEGPFTVFAPMNNSFAALPQRVTDALLANPTADLTQILLFHVVPGKVMAADLSDGLAAETFQGESINFNVADGLFSANGVEIILTDIETSNGVIHVIDGVLIPEAVNLAALTLSAVVTPPAATEEPAPAATPAPSAPVTPVIVGTDPLILPAVNELGEITTRSLRLRAAPNADAEVLWGVRQGEFYPVVDRTADGLWLALAVPEVTEQGGIGWVSSEFVAITQDFVIIPTLGSATVNTSDGFRLRVRSLPSTDGELKEFLQEGETYEVVATTEDGSWTLLNLATANNVPIPGPSWVATEFITISGFIE